MDDEAQVMSLRLDTWAAMLASDDLAISSEKNLCEIVLKYAKHFEDKEQREAALTKLLPLLRFGTIPPKYLVDVIENDESINRVPIVHTLLYEAYRFRVCCSLII